MAGSARSSPCGRRRPDAAFEDKNSLARLQGAMGGLTETHAQILVMREFEGRSYQEIGERLGPEPSGRRVRRSSARAAG
jgi:DNA-directed RNA polymerase specialized sigma24 family protein